MNKLKHEKAIILFDGCCNFCNSSVNFVVRHNNKDCFLFIPIQSETAKEFLKKFNLPEQFLGSIVLIEKDKIFFKSTAVLRIIRRMNPVMNWLFVFIVVPKFLRDAVYDWIAKHRNRLTNEKSNCVVDEK